MRKKIAEALAWSQAAGGSMLKSGLPHFEKAVKKKTRMSYCVFSHMRIKIVLFPFLGRFENQNFPIGECDCRIGAPLALILFMLRAPNANGTVLAR
ncbi:MAG TPA: hypothetical protein DIT28_00685 [Oxalobacteraceae bacterium]|nr:hypothetical protein [Oxalobacteraceae bacterium]HCN87689.1 hypothetical protein [Oxalobacteraceae bacterium]